MRYLKRIDGYNNTIATHGRAVGCGDLEEIIRDRTIAPEISSEIYFRCANDDLRLGDIEVTEAEYDAFHTVMTIQNYQNKFIPQKEQNLLKIQTEHTNHKNEKEKLISLGLTPSNILKNCNCEVGITSLNECITNDKAELSQCQIDKTNGGVRKRRLHEECDRLARELPECISKCNGFKAIDIKTLNDKQQQTHAILLERAEADIKGRESRLAVIKELLK